MPEGGGREPCDHVWEEHSGEKTGTHGTMLCVSKEWQGGQCGWSHRDQRFLMTYNN